MNSLCAKSNITTVLLVVLTFLGLTSSAQLDLSRGPYLQKLTPNSVTIRWNTLTASDSKVTFGKKESELDKNVSSSTSGTDHTIVLTDLEPATRYYYSVGSSSAVMQSGAENYFITSPVPGMEGKYTFWVTGDCGNNSTNQKNVLAAYNTYMGDRPTHGWLTLGDNAYTGGLDLEFTTSFFNIYQENIMKHAPLWPAPGNHDYNNLPLNQITQQIPYYDIFDLPSNGEAGGVASGTEAFYSYDYGNAHFLSLDSYGQEDLLFRLYDTLGPQAQWVKRDLAANTKKFVIAYWHHPPYTMASHNSDTESELVSMRSQFVPFLEKLGVDMVICGHSHGYERSRPIKGHTGMETTFDSATMNMDGSTGKYDGTENSCTYLQDEKHTNKGTIYVVAGSAGQLGGQQTAYPHNAMYFSDVENGGSMILEFEDNRMDAKWLNTDGQIRDNFTLIKDSNKETNLTVVKGQSVTLKASWPGTYIWDHTQSKTREVTITPTESGTYRVSDEQQCVTDVYNITVQDPNSVTEVVRSESFRIYPNPANNELNIEANLEGLSAVIISDITGRKVFEENTTGVYKKKLNTSTFPKGIYMVHFRAGQSKGSVQKLIIE